MPWDATQLRLTAFPTPTAIIDKPDWWAHVTGEGPEQTSSNVKQALFETTGTFADGVLGLKVQPLRIDWLYSPALPDNLTAFRESIGPFQAAIEHFARVMDRWLASADCPDLMRLAFGSVLLDSVESRQAGYERLRRFLPALTLDAENSADLSYQINRPRRSTTVADLKVNRLSKWSVGAFQTMMVNEGGIALAGKRFSCRLETDINSDAEYGQPLRREAMANLFREFVALTVEISERGDVA